MSAQPIDFSKYESAAPPIDFSKYAGGGEKTEEPGFLDKEIPLSGAWYNPTLSGVQSIGRGVKSAGEGLYNTVRHPIDTAKSLGEIPSQVGEVPGAIHDINASPDPLGTYAKVGQETAGQGAGQALVGLATEGIAKGAPVAARGIGKAARATGSVIRDVATPENLATAAGGAVGGALGHTVGAPLEMGAGGAVVGRTIGKAIAKRLAAPAEDALDATAENKPYAGAPRPKFEKELDATGENKPFLGGMDEPLPPKKPVGRINAPEETGPIKEAAPLAEKTESAAPAETSNIAPPETSKIPARGIRTPPPASEPGTLESRLSGILNNIRAEDAAKAATPGPEEDLTPILQRSLDEVKARKGIGRANATPSGAQGISPEAATGNDAYPVKIVYDEHGIPTAETDGRHRVIQAIENGQERIPVVVNRGHGPVETTVDPKVLAREMGVTKKSLGATDEQQIYRKGKLQPREPTLIQ